MQSCDEKIDRPRPVVKTRDGWPAPKSYGLATQSRSPLDPRLGGAVNIQFAATTEACSQATI